MYRILHVAAFCALLTVAVPSFAADASRQPKTGPIKAVDAKAKTFEVTLPARPLTFTCNDKTTITLDGKASTFEEAIKVERKATVTYQKEGDARVASKVEVVTEEKK